MICCGFNFIFLWFYMVFWNLVCWMITNQKREVRKTILKYCVHYMLWLHKIKKRKFWKEKQFMPRNNKNCTIFFSTPTMLKYWLFSKFSKLCNKKPLKIVIKIRFFFFFLVIFKYLRYVTFMKSIKTLKLNMIWY